MDRLIVLLSYIAAFAILVVVVAAISGATFGPVELVIVLLLAVPVVIVVSRVLRSRLVRDAERRT